jgi:cytochrome c553
MKKITLIFSIFLITCSLSVFGQEWSVPEEDKNMENPLELNDENTEAGKEIYITNCKACHGDPGLENYNAALNPIPPDPASEQMQNLTDGEIFYVLKEGKGVLMVSFAPVLSEDQRWQLVQYIRSLGGDNNEAVAEISEGQKVKIDIALNEKDETINAGVTTFDEEGNPTPLAGANVVFAIKRTFGNLPFSTVKTNSNGEVVTEFPHDIPGNENGLLDLIVYVEEMKDHQFILEGAQIGEPHTPIDIYEKRVMWSYNTNTQWWVILSYLSVVVGVWLTILYVVFETLNLKKLGKKTA